MLFFACVLPWLAQTVAAGPIAFRGLLNTTNVTSNPSSYLGNAVCTTDLLLRQYSISDGMWDGDYWQSANILSAVADIFSMDPLYHSKHGNSIFENSYNNAWKKFNYENFINNYNDDEGWWALAFINIYDLTKDEKYLSKAEALFEDMQKSNDTPCGGIWWSKDKQYVSSIANELYIQIAAGLANRVSPKSNQEKYFKIADDTFDWFFKSGVVSSGWIVSDGLKSVSVQSANGSSKTTCQPEGSAFTYNQGVILGAAAELHAYKGDSKYLDRAGNIANAVISKNSTFTVNGILGDKCDRQHECTGDGEEFKGPFVRNLRKLYLQDKKQQWKDFLERQAQSIWENDLNMNSSMGGCSLGLYWAGPWQNISNPGVAQGIGLDAINAALATSQSI